MDVRTREQVRRQSSQKRVRPSHSFRVTLSANGRGQRPTVEPSRPLHILLEATDPDGELVEWLNDDWWIETLREWKDRLVTLTLMPTPSAMLHPVVYHQLEMIRRVSPNWRIEAQVHGEELSNQASHERLLAGPYDEVVLLSSPNESNGNNGQVLKDLLQSLHGRKSALGVNRPRFCLHDKASALTETATV